MNDEFIYWILVAAVIALSITIVGRITSKNLPAKQKKIRLQKFGAVALAFFALCVPVFRPFISSYSNARYSDELIAENLNSVENLANFQKTQTRQIEALKREVGDLRDDLRDLNRYYGTANQILWNGIAIGIILFAFRKRKTEDTENLEEVRPEQISNL